MLHDELVIETDVSIAEEMLTLAKQKMEESAGLVFKDVPMLVVGKPAPAFQRVHPFGEDGHTVP